MNGKWSTLSGETKEQTMSRPALALRDAAPRYTAPPIDQSALLARAAVRAADLLELTGEELARIIGISPASVSRLRHGKLQLAPESKSGELAVMLLRAFRALDAVVGSRDELARAWLNAANADLDGVPRELLRQVDGLARVVGYLDAVRGAR
jgi:transcriptional regulator with XRE-family HTH domain